MNNMNENEFIERNAQRDFELIVYANRQICKAEIMMWVSLVLPTVAVFGVIVALAFATQFLSGL